ISSNRRANSSSVRLTRFRSWKCLRKLASSAARSRMSGRWMYFRSASSLISIASICCSERVIATLIFEQVESFGAGQAEDDVLVHRRVRVVAGLVGGEAELGLKAEGGGGFGTGFGSLVSGHQRVN